MAQDRISYLPSCILYEIFKFLDMRDVVQTSVLSKKWKVVWVSNPHLNFNFTGRDDWVLDKKLDHSFKKFVNTTLRDRDRNSAVQSFSLEYFSNCKPVLINNWVTRILGENLRVVKFSFLRVYEPYVRELCKVAKDLMFLEVGFLGGENSNELLLSCPIMESFKMEECYHVKNFAKYGGEDKYNEIKICAPKLMKLHIGAGSSFSKSYSLEKLSSLVTAAIDIYGYQEVHLTSLFKGLVNAKCLELSANMLRVSSEGPNMLSSVDIFANLSYLKLTNWMISDGGISSILKLLEKSPNLETLILCGPNPLEPELREEDLGEELLLWCRLCHVVAIELRCRVLTENAYKFLKFVLENVLSLKDVLLTINWQDYGR